MVEILKNLHQRYVGLYLNLILPSFIVLYWVLLGFIRFWLGFNGKEKSQRSTSLFINNVAEILKSLYLMYVRLYFNIILPSFIVLYCVLLGFIRLWLGSNGTETSQRSTYLFINNEAETLKSLNQMYVRLYLHLVLPSFILLYRVVLGFLRLWLGFNGKETSPCLVWS